MLILQTFPQIVSAHSSFLSFSIFPCCRMTAALAALRGPSGTSQRALRGAGASNLSPLRCPGTAALSRLAPFGSREPAPLRPQQLAVVPSAAGALRQKGSAGLRVLPAGGTVPYTAAMVPSPCTVTLSHLFCHPYLTLLGSPIAKLSRLSVEPGGGLFSPKKYKM